jgi:CheY-like chemotaxis protein
LKACILIVGDDPVLLHTRAELLRDWQTVTANSWDAQEAMLARKYDLLIFSQTVQETVVRNLIDQALELNPESRILAIRSVEDRHFGSPTYQVELTNPGGLRSAVARILDHRPTPSEGATTSEDKGRR